MIAGNLMNNDAINHPVHYQGNNGLEVFDVMEAFMSDVSGIDAVCMGNVIKYILRWKHKNGVEDLKKARWYLNKLIDNQAKTLEARNDE